MSADKEYTYAQIAEHSAKKDLFLVIHDKVYDTTSFVDEHPGGEEVLLDVGGQDATEAFEDVGHSDEAREILEGLLIGKLKRQEGDPKPKITTTTSAATSANNAAGLGFGIWAIIFSGFILAYGAYRYSQYQEAGVKI
ncbi:cytochrome b5 [Hyaloscypha variabilis]|uniref:Cytochrome b5 n=1 Tax=Hyaloscypha variabilis (strain UAMH 11265 / GT02V1 / F) TaxID=1149755 RepID=A0A2J6RAR0_HYAVF|nr:cytochrome b5 [Hyaloscypha variabilis F]